MLDLPCQIVGVMVNGPTTRISEVQSCYPGILLGFGLGLAAYGCWRLLLGKSSESPATLSEPQDVLHAHEVAQAVVLVEPAEESLSLAEHTVEVSREEPEEDPALPEQEKSLEPSLDSALETAEEDQVPESKSWYLIATSKGLLRACKCSAPTSHTVAGPFDTKRAAQLAKQQYEGRSVRPL